jgi:DNA topoisomerase-1
MGKSLVIVESEAKTSTIERYLGKGFDVMATHGHVRDLSKEGDRQFGVDIENGFAPIWKIDEDKKAVVKELKKAAKRAEAVYIATDPDREGEAIGWHLWDLLELAPAGNGDDDDKAVVFRILLEEITKTGIDRAFKDPLELDPAKFDAYKARRVLDRIIGFSLSAVLRDKVPGEWKKITGGRVQSVAVRMIVDREREIKAFIPEESWEIKAHLEGAEPPAFDAKLTLKDGEKVAIANEKEALAILAGLGNVDPKIERDEENNIVPLATDGVEWTITEIVAKERKRGPKAPFTTAQLQQDAAGRLGFSVGRTMSVANDLYRGLEIGDEGSVGLITYIRTDSTRASTESQKAAKEVISTHYGENFTLSKPRTFKAGKRAQEAHEAIRPTSISRTPEQLERYLSKDQARLYQLIWSRFVASQMQDAVYDQTSVQLEAKGAASGTTYLFRATGSVIKFDGWLKAYPQTERDKDASRLLPKSLQEGHMLNCLELRPRQKFTQPPARFNEASLVRTLEKNGIGRPSTYAPILRKLRNSPYIKFEERRFHPEELGAITNDQLVLSFPRIMEIEYTAKVEDRLDNIQAGKEDWVGAIARFWKRFEPEIDHANKTMRDLKSEEVETTEVCDKDDEETGEKCGKPMVIKLGRFGRYLRCTGHPECSGTKNLKKDGEVAETFEPEPTGEDCPKCGEPLVRKKNRWGQFFVGCSGWKPKNSKPPGCSYIQQEKVGVKCPDCGGELVKRRARRGNTFYGCDGYPNCKHTSPTRPVPIKCPECEQPYLVIRQRKNQPEMMACRNKECDFETEAAEQIPAG